MVVVADIESCISANVILVPSSDSELARLLPRQQPSQRSMKVPQFRLGRWPYGEQVLEFLCPLLSLGYAEIWVDAKSLVADVELRLQFLSSTGAMKALSEELPTLLVQIITCCLDDRIGEWLQQLIGQDS
jgi:hypothetical protein